MHLSADTYAFIRRPVPRHCVGDMQPPYAVCQLPDAGIYMTNASNSVWQACLATQCADMIIQGEPSIETFAASAENQATGSALVPTTTTTTTTATKDSNPTSLTATQQQTTSRTGAPTTTSQLTAPGGEQPSTARSLLGSTGGGDSDDIRAGSSSRALLSRLSREELFESGDDSTALLNIIRPLDPERIVFLFAYRGGIALIQMDGVVRVYRRLTAAQTESGNPGWAELFSMPPLEGGETVLAYVCVAMRVLVVYTTGGRILRLQVRISYTQIR